MKELNRIELRNLAGGKAPSDLCLDVTCRCSDFHPEWEQWSATYCNVQDMYSDLNAICGEGFGYCFG